MDGIFIFADCPRCISVMIQEYATDKDDAFEQFFNQSWWLISRSMRATDSMRAIGSVFQYGRRIKVRVLASFTQNKFLYFTFPRNGHATLYTEQDIKSPQHLRGVIREDIADLCNRWITYYLAARFNRALLKTIGTL